MKELKGYKGIFEDRGKLLTINLDKGKSVYGERLVKIQGIEYRQWDPNRSKLGAAIKKNVNIPNFNSNSTMLYLGCSYGTTVSHVSDILKDGFVYALDFAPRVMRDFLFMIENRKNVAPIIGDAYHPERYESQVSLVDFLFQDVAQKTQVDIFKKNLRFLKNGGIGIFAVKARSIDVAKSPKAVFSMVKRQLNEIESIEILEEKSLEPFEEDHCVFIVKKR
jgi:fibrillarin-like pre-rRNA processing protein